MSPRKSQIVFTGKQYRAAGMSLADADPVMCWFSNERKEKVVNAVTLVMDEELMANPGMKPDPKVVKARTKEQLKGAFPVVILGAVIAWFVTKLMDYLWNRFSYQN
jgi:hypothetical protein